MDLFTYINWELILGDGLTITLIGYLIVFLALVLLSLVFTYVPKIMRIQARRNLKKRGKSAMIDPSKIEISGEVNAAIGTAIFLFFDEQHDIEDPIITIKRISKNYTPWSSKIYGVTRGLNRRF
jgi:Na+-transporting methylmalonyl-CoA/oxaloacetate decarboxylase gamma subunit